MLEDGFGVRGMAEDGNRISYSGYVISYAEWLHAVDRKGVLANTVRLIESSIYRILDPR